MMKSIDFLRADRYVVREMMRVVFLLNQSHMKAAGAVFSAFRRFQEFASEERTYLLNNPGGDWDDFENSALLVEAVRERLLSEPMEPNCSLIVCSDDSNISDYSFAYAGFNLDDVDFEEWRSPIVLTFPLHAYEQGRPRFQSLFMDLLEILPMFAGYATRSLEGDQNLCQKVSKRYLGLDISSVSSIAKDIGNSAPGSFWLNAFKGELGEVMKSQLALNGTPPETRVASVAGGGIVVLTSTEPSRLAIGSTDPIDGCRWLAQNLDAAGKFHLPRRVIYFEDEEDVEDIDAQILWHSRFLRRG